MGSADQSRKLQLLALRPALSLAFSLTVACLCVQAAPAAAYTVQQNGSQLSFSASVGEVNSVTVGLPDPGTLSISDGGALPSGALPAGCSDEGGGTVNCSRAGRGALDVSTGDQDDVVTLDVTGLPTVADGGDGSDQLFGAGAGEDLRGGLGNDQIDGGDGNDRLDGGGGDDQLGGSAGADVLLGGDGADVVAGDLGADAIDGGAGDDDLSGGAEADVVSGGDGADRMAGDEANDLMVGGEGPDAIDAGDGDDSARGGSGDDTIDGGSGRDDIAGEPGTDQLVQSDGGGPMDGGEGDDGLQGGVGADQLQGGPGNDRLLGDQAGDSLSGGDGVDVLDGGEGADTQAGGPGADTVTYQFAGGRVRVALDGRANDGTAGEGDNDAADIETVIGSVSDDALLAARSGTSLVGGPGRDRLTGSTGRDVLDGQEDDDLLDGAGGADKLIGGAGRDEATYASRSKPVRVSLDDRGNDGARGERDDVRRTVESVTGGRSGDRFSGAKSIVNRFSGGRGNDRVSALDDDSSVDVVQCGAGIDRVSADDIDRVRGDCERIARTGRALPLRLLGVSGRPGGRAAGRVRCGFRTVLGCRGSIGLYVYTRSRRVFVGSTRIAVDAGVARRFSVRGGPRRLHRLARGRSTLRGVVVIRARDRLGRAGYLTRRVRVGIP